MAPGDGSRVKRVSLYSSSDRKGRDDEADAPSAVAADPLGDDVAPAAPDARPRSRWRAGVARFERPLLVAAGAAFALLLAFVDGAGRPGQRPLTQDDIDDAVMQTLETKTLPSQEARANAAVFPSVVRVRGFGPDRSDKESKDIERSVGSGVVIVDNGTILTNLHVVTGAEKLTVVFYDGMESEATVIGAQPENDLAVLKAKSVPDDLQPATLRSTADLLPGDHVVAVGFPFGVGPSTSAGVVSGLNREYRSPHGEKVLTNLIQFDAAANPGSSGGPLVTTDGQVVGIVTAILSPGQQRTFIGIGFAVPIENAASAIGMSPF
jgi:S1-C subfamily serine protease